MQGANLCFLIEHGNAAVQFLRLLVQFKPMYVKGLVIDFLRSQQLVEGVPLIGDLFLPGAAVSGARVPPAGLDFPLQPYG